MFDKKKEIIPVELPEDLVYEEKENIELKSGLIFKNKNVYTKGFEAVSVDDNIQNQFVGCSHMILNSMDPKNNPFVNEVNYVNAITIIDSAMKEFKCIAFNLCYVLKGEIISLIQRYKPNSAVVPEGMAGPLYSVAYDVNDAITNNIPNLMRSYREVYSKYASMKNSNGRNAVVDTGDFLTTSYLNKFGVDLYADIMKSISMYLFPIMGYNLSKPEIVEFNTNFDRIYSKFMLDLSAEAVFAYDKFTKVVNALPPFTDEASK